MDKQQTIKEIREYPVLYFDDLIESLHEQGKSKDLIKRWVEFVLE